jgi:hypothetical protein
LVDLLEARRLMAGTPTFTVTFDDPRGRYSDYHQDVRSTLLAAAADWAKHIDSSAKIELLVDFDSSLTVPTLAAAGFDRRVFFRQAGGYDVELGNVAAELRTGRDSNGTAYDAFISIRPGALDEFYYDPTPGRSGNVPGNRIDARTVLLHELGHTLGFFGDGDGPADSPAGDRFAYDQYISLDDNGDLYFSGPNAMSVYGAPVPLSYEDSSHLGNEDGPGEDIADDLMAPTIPDGARRFISELDLAILADAGVPMKVSNIPSVEVSDVVVTRTGVAGQTADFVLTLTKASSQTVTVPVGTAGGTALAGRDYVAASRTVKFLPGETSKTVSVKLLPGSVFDGTKSFSLILGLPTNAALLRGGAVATVKNGLIAADARHVATFKGSGGNVVTVNVRGPGVAVIGRDSKGNLDTVTITGSNAATVLVIRGKKPTLLRGVTANGGLGGIDAPQTDFAGTMKLTRASAVRFRDLLAGSAITFGAAPTALSFVARNVFESTITTNGIVRSITTNHLRESTVRARGTVDSISVASAVSSDVFVGTNSFATSTDDFTNKRAVLKSFVVRKNGLFSNARVAAPLITTASLGTVNADNADVTFGVAADRVGAVTASTPLEPSFKRTDLRAAQDVAEDDFVLRVL